VDAKRAATSIRNIGGEAVSGLPQMFDQMEKQIDAVLVATPDQRTQSPRLRR